MNDDLEMRQEAFRQERKERRVMKLAGIDLPELAMTVFHLLLKERRDHRTKIASTATVYDVLGQIIEDRVDEDMDDDGRAILAWRLLGVTAQIIMMRHLAGTVNITCPDKRYVRRVCLSMNERRGEPMQFGTTVSFEIADPEWDRAMLSATSWAEQPRVPEERPHTGWISMDVFTDALTHDLEWTLDHEPWNEGKTSSRSNCALLPKIMVDLAGLDAYDLESVERYADTQREFVVSCSALHLLHHSNLPLLADMPVDQIVAGDLKSGWSNMGDRLTMTDPIALLDLINGMFVSLLYGGNDECGRRKVTGKIEWLGVPWKLNLFDAVYGACRFRKTDGSLFNDVDLSACMTQGHALELDTYYNIVVPTDDPDHMGLSWGLGSTVRDLVYRNERRYRGTTWVDPRIGLYDFDEEPDATTWADCLPPTGTGERSWGDCVFGVVPDDLRRTVTLDRLKGLESRTRFMKDVMFLECWDANDHTRLRNSLRNGLDDAPTQVVHKILKHQGNLDPYERWAALSRKTAGSYLIPVDGTDSTAGSMADPLDGVTPEDVADPRRAHARKLVRKTQSVAQIISLLEDDARSDGDGYAGSTLLDVIMMVSAACVFMEEGLKDLWSLDIDGDGYDALARVCFDLDREATSGTDLYDLMVSRHMDRSGHEGSGENGGLTGMDAKSSAGHGGTSYDGEDHPADVVAAFVGAEDALVDGVFRRLVMLMGTDPDGLCDKDYPRDFLDETLSMHVQAEYEDAIRSMWGANAV